MKRMLLFTAVTLCLVSCSINRDPNPVLLLEDFDYFFQSFEQTHPEPYSAFGGEKSFHKGVKRLRRTLTRTEDLNEDRLQAEIGRFLVPLHDGHTFAGGRTFRRSRK